MLGIEQVAALIERRLQGGDQRDKSADRIVGSVGIRDMALAGLDNQRAVERTAPSGLDGVADARDVARLAENAMVKLFAARGRPLQKLDRAVDRDAFLIPCNQQRDRSAARP